MNIDESNQENITNTMFYYESNSSWPPDGNKVSFTHI